MTWLTDEEREQNRLENEQAQKEGFSDAYSKRQYESTSFLRSKVNAIKSKISSSEINTIIEAYKKGLL